jgi:DNA-binding transcriptional MerR regulator
MGRSSSSRNARKTRARPVPVARPGSALKIGEAAQVVGVEPYVLRFWETQFSFIRPRHARSRHRYYEPKDIETLKLIKRLLHTQGFTIAGAKKHIREHGLDRLCGTPSVETQEPLPSTATTAEAGSAIVPQSAQRTLASIRDDLRLLHKLLGS